MLPQFSTPAFGDPRLPARFWAKVRVLENGCWQWTAAHSKGYGQFQVGSHNNPRMAPAHRWAYELLVGPIPEGLEPDHLCHNGADCSGGPICSHRACVNPRHIEPVTRRENLRRGYHAERRKTHCPQGHAYDVVNTYRWRGRSRQCRACRRR